VGCKAGLHTLHPTTRPGREGPRREEITTELTPREGNDGSIDAGAVTGPSNVAQQ
jgi:hypothetical protein